MGNITGVFQTVPLDWFVLGGIFLLLALDSLRSGIGRAVALSVALPLAYFLFSLVKSAAFIGGSGLIASITAQAAVFGGLVVLCYFLARRMGLEYIDGGMGEPIQAIIGAAAATAILTIVWLEIPALGALWTFSAPLKTLFAESFRLWWLIGAYGALAFARG